MRMASEIGDDELLTHEIWQTLVEEFRALEEVEGSYGWPLETPVADRPRLVQEWLDTHGLSAEDGSLLFDTLLDSGLPDGVEEWMSTAAVLPNPF
jgi:hypothetical protein